MVFICKVSKLIYQVLLFSLLTSFHLPSKQTENKFVKRKQVLPYATPACGESNPGVICTLECDEDPDCQLIGFNVSIYSCACPAQICSDGKLYGYPNYDNPPN
jgi:hypothetical protein